MGGIPRLIVVLVGVSFLVLAGTADAQEPGVTYDPKSPAGQEYAIPLDSVRRQTAPPAQDIEGAPQASREPVPLFGEGVSPPARRGDARTREQVAGGRQRGQRNSEGQAPSQNQDAQETGASPEDDEASRPPSASTLLSGNSRSTPTGLVIAGLAAALGLTGGLFARRRQRVD